MVNERDCSELNAGALQRYLAEAPMFPTALLPSQGVSWDAIDDTHACACIGDGVTTTQLDFEFADSGEIVGVSTPSRYRSVNGHYVSSPWGGRYRRYETLYGMRVPIEADVHWLVDGCPKSYITVSVKSARYGFARQPQRIATL
jgi:hypothetical protein